jgi:phage tail protein X
MAQYLTREGDMLDRICWKFYGRQSGAVEVVLEANPHLADQGPLLPAGIVIELPVLAEPEVQESESGRLWT